MERQNNISFSAVELYPTPSRPEGQKDVLELKFDPIKTVRIGFIGVGIRGMKAVKRYVHIDGIEIKAFCDLSTKNIEEAQSVITEGGFPKADEYTGLSDWKKVCERDDIDLIYIATSWNLHTDFAVYAMEQGRHVAVEIPAAVTIKEAWRLVDTAERTQRHCMGLENCIYEPFQMAAYEMVDAGLLGEIMHVEGGYIHDLRSRNFVEGEKEDSGWELTHLENRDGNIYPTHGFGPLCHVLNIHRGDRLNYLVSLSSNQAGMTEYTTEKFGKDSDFAKRTYKLGDMNTSLLKTVKGKSLLLQQNITNPRPYSRLFMINGTKGFVQQYPIEGIALDPDAHDFLSKEEADKLFKEYEHPIITEIGKKAETVGGHGGIDFIMDYRLIYCLRNGLPLDQDVYDAAEWASIAELSEVSVANDSMPVKVPDFTRGAWDKLKKVTYYQK